MSYRIFTDATADLNEKIMYNLPLVEIISMDVEINNKSYTYGPDGNLTVEEFYGMQREGKFATTSQINPEVYRKAFEPALQDGLDILYLCFSSGLSGTINSARLAISELNEKYPNRKMICIDTLCASVGEALLVSEAARKQAEGMTLEELAGWVEENRLRVCHWFTVDTFEHLRYGGRVSAAAATIGNVLNIKPLLHVDEQGMLKVVEKPRGLKRAISSKLVRMEQGWMPEISNSVIIGHADCPDEAEQLKVALHAKFPDADIVVADIGPVIGAHTGPGLLAIIYWGSTR